MTKVFIDGSAGTTGLQIYERLAARSDIELLTLSDADRKNLACRKEALNSCDVAMLCLPDAASREAVAMIENPAVRVIDTSTAHRTAPGWAYGFPELSEAHREAIASAKCVANPGCHASGFIALVYPLVEAGLLPPDALLSCHSLTGYSGGGKSMIADYEDDARPAALDSPRQYGLTQEHKHLIEMRKITGLDNDPLFCPIVADFYSGMLVTVPLFTKQLKAGTMPEDVRAVYKQKFTSPVLSYRDDFTEGGLAAANALSGTDAMEVSVFGNGERILLCSVFDNLGKGASGAAVQNLNIMLGLDEATSLVL